MTNFPWLTTIGLIPLVGALVVAFLPASLAEKAKHIALGFSLVALLFTVAAALQFKTVSVQQFQLAELHPWIKQFGVSYAVGVDGIALVMIVMAAILVPVCVLAAWHDVPPVKAMFFSIVSCWRNRGAFIVFGALWFAVAMTVSLGLSTLMQALGAGDFAFAILMPATMIVTTMLYCSFYATYRGCFGVQSPEAPDLPTTPAA